MEDAGIDNNLYQSRDALFAGATWTESDLNKIRRLIDMGFKVSATGGLTKDTLKVFEGIPIYIHRKDVESTLLKIQRNLLVNSKKKSNVSGVNPRREKQWQISKM